MVRIGDNDLRIAAEYDGVLTPTVCSHWVERFQGAAPWLLTPEALDGATRDPELNPHLLQAARGSLESRRVPSVRGGCSVLFVRPQAGVERSPLVRRTFVLPLMWVQGRDHSPHLPNGLRDLAAQAVRLLLPEKERSWGLQLAASAGLEGLDLSGLTLSCDSGWASVAAALLLAEAGGIVNPDVFASVAWEEGFGFVGVEGLAEKIGLARELGGRAFFVAVSQHDRVVKEKLDDGLRVGYLPVGERDPRAALKDLLHELEYPPYARDGASLESRCRYANGFTDREARENYILENLTEDIAERLSRDLGDVTEAERLAVIMSSPSAALLSIRALKPKRALLIHTSRDRKDAGRVRDRVPETTELICREVGLDGHEELEGIVYAYLAEGKRHGPCYVDVTGGTKGMTAITTWAAQRSGAGVFHVISKTGGYLHLAGTESICVVKSPLRP